MRKAALFYNPVSGSRLKHRLKDIETAKAVLTEAGVEVEVAPTRAASDAAAQVRMAIRDGFDTIIACGGDGTIHDVLQGMAGKQAALGIIPLGTANAMAHDLRLPLTPAGAAQALLTAVPKRIAVGRIDYRDLRRSPDVSLFHRRRRRRRGRALVLQTQSPGQRPHGHARLLQQSRASGDDPSHALFEAEFSGNGGSPQQEARLSEMLAVRINYFGGLLRELAPGASLARNDLRLVLCRTGNRAMLCGLCLSRVSRDVEGRSAGSSGHSPTKSPAARFPERRLNEFTWKPTANCLAACR